MLARVIEDGEFGEIVGKEKDGEVGLAKIRAAMPDIVIISLLII